MNEKQIREKLKKLNELEIARIYIEEKNKRFKTTFKEPVEGDDPPDAVSYDEEGNELKIEITKYGPEFWEQILTRDFISGDVEFIQWLISGLKKKAGKHYGLNWRKELIILLEGFTLPDDYFEKNERHFLELSFNRRVLEKLGFREIWYVSRTKKRAFQIY